MISIQQLGRIPYREVWTLQETLRQARLKDEVPDTILLCEHPPVFTLGRRDCSEDFLAVEGEITAAGIDVVRTNRGGRVTYHGPGQLVGYFIFDVRSRGVERFVHDIEAFLINTSATWGLEAARDDKYPGVWIGERKIAAIGLHISHGISQHGFALNVSPDMSHYKFIIACGIKDRGVTSLQMELEENAPTMAEVRKAIANEATSLFAEFQPATNVGPLIPAVVPGSS